VDRDAAVLRQIRDGRDPLVDVRMTPAKFADTLKNWRAGHGFTQIGLEPSSRKAAKAGAAGPAHQVEGGRSMSRFQLRTVRGWPSSSGTSSGR